MAAETPLSELADALRKIVRGEVLIDDAERQRCATDASIYEIEPLVVVHPKDEADVVATLKFGAERKIPVIARGGGSGLAGESLGRAIILDVTVHMNRVLSIDAARRMATVEPGLILDRLNDALAPHGLRWPVDPSSKSRCTIGGMIANNTSGAHCLHFGDTKANLVAARVCFSDGTVTIAQPVKTSGEHFEQKKREPGIAGKIHRELPELLAKNAALIASKKLKTERDRSGYQLGGVLDGDIFDIARLICGSEGTLGIVTQAVLKLEPLPQAVGMAVLCFASVVDAVRAIPAIRSTSPVCCELLDQKLMDLGREGQPRLAPLLPVEARALLIIEYEGRDEAHVHAQLQSLKDKLPAGSFLKLMIVTDVQEQNGIWALRDSATPLLYKRSDGLQPIPIVEDGVVPITRLADYIERAGKVFEQFGLPWSAYAHAGHGEVHLRPMLDLRRSEHVALLEPIAEKVHAIVWELGGTISGEHAEGLVRTQFSPRQAGPELYGLFRQIKSLFDPQRLLNPDKKISDDPHLMLRNLRKGPYTIDVPATARRK